MWILPKKDAERSGFALLVVLSGLLVLTLLFAISSARTIAKLEKASTVATLNFQLLVANAAIDLGVRSNGKDFNFEYLGQIYNVALQDVGGLVDLNFALPDLRQHLFDKLGLPEDADDRYIAWRRGGPHGSKRIVRVEQLIEITNSSVNVLPTLLATTTVFSGRTGISKEVAPQRVMDLVGQGAPENWNTPPSSTVYNVVVNGPKVEMVLVGTIGLVADGKARVLERRFDRIE